MAVYVDRMASIEGHLLKFIRIKADKYMHILLYIKIQADERVQYICSYMPTLANTKLLKSIETESVTEHT